MNKSVYIFDLDDTIVQYNKRRIVVPKQTWHMLKKLKRNNAEIFIISYNPLAQILGAQLGLYKHVNAIICGEPPRYSLIEILMEKYPHIKDFDYFDDRLDNIQEILEKYPNTRCHHVTKIITCKDL